MTEKIYKKRRTSLQIMVQILTQCSDGSKKTHIVYTANLNFQMLNGYLIILISKEMIREEDNFFVTTEIGKQFLNTIHSFNL
jgi:predicted transcriptional regulator